MASTDTTPPQANLIARSDRVLASTRVLAIFIIPFLVVAAVILYVFPEDSGRLFAWPIKPPVMAMALASAYTAGIYYFTRAAIAREWHTIKAGLLPVTAFASLLGLATLLHWDRFTHGHLAFWTWSILYFATPFLVFGAWLHNRPADDGRFSAVDAEMPSAGRGLLGIMGAATLLISLVLFIDPGLMIGMWPWTLTPLTARVLSAMYALPGVVGLELAAERRWSVARVILEALALSLIMILIGIVRTWSSFDRAQPTFWMVLLGIALPAAAIIVLYAVMQNRARPAAGSVEDHEFV